jgi:hypothetical protein
MNLDDPLQLEFFINLPALITLIVGIVLTSANRHRHPAAARWVLLGFGWLFSTYVLSILWRNIVMPHLFRHDIDLEIFSLVGLSICESLAYVFFLVAFFVALTPYPPRHFYEDDLLDDIPRRPTRDKTQIQDNDR